MGGFPRDSVVCLAFVTGQNVLAAASKLITDLGIELELSYNFSNSTLTDLSELLTSTRLFTRQQHTEKNIILQ